MQSRALVARVSSARGVRCASLTAPVGVLMEITLHVQHNVSSCVLSIYQRAPHEIEHLAVIARVFALAFRLCFETILVSAGALLSSLPALCFRLCRRSAFVSAGTQRLVSAGALLSLLSSGFWSLLCTSLSSALLVLLCHSSRRRLFSVRLCFCICLYSAFARRSRLSTQS